jgi:hypothetical protein
VLEFANARRAAGVDALSTRSARLYDGSRGADRSLAPGPPLSPLLADLRLRWPTTDIERVENAFKGPTTYLARSRRRWRSSGARPGAGSTKLAIMRDTYSMLNAESQSARGEVLEVAIVLLIVLELVLSLAGRH